MVMLLVVSDLSEVSVTTRTSFYGHCRLKFILFIPCLCRQLGDALTAYPLYAAFLFFGNHYCIKLAYISCHQGSELSAAHCVMMTLAFYHSAQILP